MNTVPVVLEKQYQLILWLLPRMAEFPKDQRFLLADRIEHTLLDVLERLIEAVYRKDKIPLLREANLGLEKSRFLMRMAKDMKYISLSRHTFFCKSADEIGRMIGGWVKFSGNQGPRVQGCGERGGIKGEVQTP
jgi:hypothetical protein